MGLQAARLPWCSEMLLGVKAGYCPPHPCTLAQGPHPQNSPALLVCGITGLSWCEGWQSLALLVLELN